MSFPRRITFAAPDLYGGLSMSEVFIDSFAYSLGERKLHVSESAEAPAGVLGS